LLAAALPCAQAQVYPPPDQVIVPFPAGGRRIRDAGSERPMRMSLGQPLVIENVTGATGSIGVARVVQSRRRLHVSIGNRRPTSSTRGVQFSNRPAEGPRTGRGCCEHPSSLDARTSIPAKTLQESSLGQGEPEAGVGGHAGGRIDPADGRESCSRSSPASPAIRALSGAAPEMQDLIAGQIDMMFDQAWNSAAASARRHHPRLCGHRKTRLASATDIPTSTGRRARLYATVWNGLWVPRARPRDHPRLNAPRSTRRRSRRAHAAPAIWPRIRGRTSRRRRPLAAYRRRGREVVADHQGGDMQNE